MNRGRSGVGEEQEACGGNEKGRSKDRDSLLQRSRWEG